MDWVAGSRGNPLRERMNVVFMGGFTYPRGMAGTKRIQNIINALKRHPEVEARVILQRQASADNVLCGTHEGTPYETVLGDVLRAKLLALLPMLYCKTFAALRRAFRPGQKNIVYFYGPLFLDSVVPLAVAKRLGYRLVFDVIEDYDLSKDVSRSPYQYWKAKLTQFFTASQKSLADGIVAITSYLENKSREATKGLVPIHCLPISVDMSCFPEAIAKRDTSNVSLFYAGTFGKKDGVLVLLEAFEQLAARHPQLMLVLTGKGDKEAMAEFSARVALSKHRERIDVKGYVDDSEYYALLNRADIHCMTRVDLAYAHAGFPFKLGEFLASGKPVVASRVSEVERFLADRESALLVRPGDVPELCSAIEFLVGNTEAAAAIGLRGRNVAQTFFDYRQQGKALVSFLETL